MKLANLQLIIMLFAKKKKNNPINSSDSVLKNPKILEVNLIKDEVGADFEWRKNIKAPLFALLAVIIIIIELNLGLSWWEKDETRRLEFIESETRRVGNEINTFRQEAAPALAYQTKTIEVAKMLNNHIYWTNFFAWLEKNTLSTVTFEGFAGNVDGKYSLAGNAGSFAEVSWQVKQFSNDPNTINAKVDLASSGESRTKEEILAAQEQATQAAQNATSSVSLVAPLETSGINFSIDLTVNPEIFKK